MISGTQTDNLATDSGAAYIFSRDGLGLWLQRAYVKPSVVGQGDNFGASVAISNDGFTLAVGATQEDSSSFGVAGDLNDNSLTDSGAVYLFWRDQQGMWAPQVFAKASNPGQSDYFGHRVALAADGDTLAVGAIRESSAATGVDGVQTDDSANAAGAVYVFTRNFLGKWSQQAYVKPLNTDAGDYFSSSLALSANGLTLAVGAGYEDSDATGVNGDSSNNAAIDSGAVHVFVYDGAWMQQSYLKPSNTHPGDTFGTSLAISDNGATLVIGATGEDSSAIGVGGDQSDVSYDGAGAAYVFVREGQGVWLQRAYLKSSNPDMLDHFGASVSVAWDGGTVAVRLTAGVQRRDRHRRERERQLGRVRGRRLHVLRYPSAPEHHRLALEHLRGQPHAHARDHEGREHRQQVVERAGTLSAKQLLDDDLLAHAWDQQHADRALEAGHHADSSPGPSARTPAARCTSAPL